MRFLRNSHYFHQPKLPTTAPTHSLRTPHLSPRHNEPNLNSMLDHRTHKTLRMALINGFLRNSHYFHQPKLPITAPTHSLRTPHLSPRHNEPNLNSMLDHRTHKTLRMALINGFLGNSHYFHQPTLHITAPTHILRDASPFTEAQRTQPSLLKHRTHTLNGLILAQLS